MRTGRKMQHSWSCRRINRRLTRRPDSKIISDKDRIATSKAPQINREELRKLLQSTRPGPPGQSGPQAPPAQPPPQAAQNQAPPQEQPAAPQQSPQPGSGFAQPRQSNQVAQLQTPPQGRSRPPNFNSSMTAGSAIEQAVQAAAANRGHYAGRGDAGDYGFPQGRPGAKALDQAEILTDTMGVDFGPYLTRVVQVVKANWYNLMPPSVYPPILKQGKLSIEFVIQKNGRRQRYDAAYVVGRRAAGSCGVGQHHGIQSVSAAAERVSGADSGVAVLLLL